jgi:HD-GYP domain-containing protein (c-di-GMP phosphodiesterase class II)
MRLVAINRVPEDAVLARDVLVGRSDGIPLLRKGVTLNERFRRGLEQAGIHAIYIDDKLSEGIIVQHPLSDEVRNQTTQAVADAYESAKETIVTGQAYSERTLNALSSVVERILLELEQTGQAALALADLCTADAYTFQHSVDVTTLGLLIGRQILHERGWVDYRGRRQFDRFDERLYHLGLGLLLHDIGKLAIPADVLHKPGPLNETEWELMKTHPRAGFELLRDSNVSPLVKSVVLRHHERWNGSGYPDGRTGTEIHEMARIAAVADVYDAVTSERVYSPATPPHVGVRIILDGGDVGFDPFIVRVFSQLVAPFPPGVDLTLEDGRHGIVVSVPDGELDRPVVRIIDDPSRPYEVSLLEDRSLEIKGWDRSFAATPAAA